MTLNITGTALGSVVQVTDRLITRTRPFQKFDPAANKNVIFLARNGLLTIGYTGRAYVGDQPTDRWIARKLALDETLQNDEMGAVETGFARSNRWMDVGQAMRHLSDEFTKAWRHYNYDIGKMQVFASGFQWPAAGWTWNLRRSRPVIWEIMSRASRREFGAVPVERYFGWERGLVTVAMLPSVLSDVSSQSLVKDLASADTPEIVIDRMVRAVREAASERDVIGSDCMSIHIPSPRTSRVVTCRYVPSGTSESAASESTYAFTPWIVAPDVKLAPTILNGFTLEVPSSSFTFKVEASDDLHFREDGSFVLFQSQPRPPLPRG
jgi:hypothetical protein